MIIIIDNNNNNNNNFIIIIIIIINMWSWRGPLFKQVFLQSDWADFEL